MSLDIEIIHDYILQLTVVSKLAGDAILEIYNSEELGVENKSDDSPLTKADLASNKVICDGLERISPEIPIISEENDKIDAETRKAWNYCWIVDPLDGTKEFIKRNGEFTTNIALVKGDKVIAGVVYIPVLEEMYYAVKGKGAFMVKENKTSTLNASKFAHSDEGLRLVCSRSHLNEATQAFVDKYKNPSLIAKGSSLKFLSIAKGEADIYPRLAPTMEWDTCAAQIILEEAGGKVIQADTHSKVIYNKENLLNPHFIAMGSESK